MNIVILAAGQGKRMRSDLPKVLHPLAGKPLLAHVITTARSLKPSMICVVYGHGGEQVRERLTAQGITWVKQEQQLGTGHAVLQALPHLDPTQPVLILYGDVPLTRTETLQRLMQTAREKSQGQCVMALLTAHLDNPAGYGRIVRSPQVQDAAGNGETGAIQRIVEEKDATPEERLIQETNTGILFAPTESLRRWLPSLRNQNAQGEYYLTDIVGLAVAEGMTLCSTQPGDAWETEGVNSPAQLAALERIHQHNIADRLLEQGVRLADPARIDVRGELICGRDVFIDVNCVFEGRVELADGVSIGANCVIKDSRLG
ncbi:MAG: NTP transferase domain-containing protein, partial [Sterolibacterium sp.]|nr:NTP transferase domain-containing protein [Sterolibacterium sp.]